MIRVVIVEDQQLLVKMFALFVNSQADMKVVGEAYDGKESLTLCRRKSPDVVLMDVAMPKMDGIIATRKIKGLLPDVAILVVSAYSGNDNVSRAIEAGAKGYLHKNTSLGELADAIRTVYSGGVVISPEIAKKALPTFRVASNNMAPELTEREVEIVSAMAQGKNNKEIARYLHISERTVRNHAFNVYRKLHIHDRTQAVLYAARRGLVDPQAIADF